MKKILTNNTNRYVGNNNTVKISFNAEITKDMHVLTKIPDKKSIREFCKNIVIDPYSNKIISSNGYVASFYDINIIDFNDILDEYRLILIPTAFFKKLCGMYHFEITDKGITVKNINNDNEPILSIECCGYCNYHNMLLAIPLVSDENFIQIKDTKEFVKNLDKKELYFYLYSRGGKVFTKYFGYDEMNVEICSEKPVKDFAYKLRIDNFKKITTKWNGMLFYGDSDKPFNIVDNQGFISVISPSYLDKYDPIKYIQVENKSKLIYVNECLTKICKEYPVNPAKAKAKTKTKEILSACNNVYITAVPVVHLPAKSQQYNNMSSYDNITLFIRLFCAISCVCDILVHNSVDRLVLRLKMLLSNESIKDMLMTEIKGIISDHSDHSDRADIPDMSAVTPVMQPEDNNVITSISSGLTHACTCMYVPVHTGVPESTYTPYVPISLYINHLHPIPLSCTPSTLYTVPPDPKRLYTGCFDRTKKLAFFAALKIYGFILASVLNERYSSKAITRIRGETN